MSLRYQLRTSGEACDKCGKPMNESMPGIALIGNSKEAGRQVVEVHIHELNNLNIKAALEHTKERMKNVNLSAHEQFEAGVGTAATVKDAKPARR